MSTTSTADAGNRSGDLHPAPFTSHFIEAGGLRLHYLEYGNRPTADRPVMLCLHGGAAHAHWFDFVAPDLLRDHRVIALDQRGHGDSQWADPPVYTYDRYAADLAEVVGKLDLRDFVLVGHSMGGIVSLLYAATYPGRLGRLVIADSIQRMTEERAATLREVGTREGSRYATREEFVSRFRLRPAGTTAAPGIIRHLAEHSARHFPDGTWRHKFDRNVYALREVSDGMANWSRIAVPALLVKAARSPRISPEILAEVRSHRPEVAFAEVADSDHHVTLDNPSGFVRAVRAFLEKR